MLKCSLAAGFLCDGLALFGAIISGSGVCICDTVAVSKDRILHHAARFFLFVIVKGRVKGIEILAVQMILCDA